MVAEVIEEEVLGEAEEDGEEVGEEGHDDSCRYPVHNYAISRHTASCISTNRHGGVWVCIMISCKNLVENFPNVPVAHCSETLISNNTTQP